MSSYTINAPEVASEQFDDEIIIVSLKTGNYYSLRGSAASIWNDLVGGISLEHLITQYSSKYGLDEYLEIKYLCMGGI